MLRAKDIVGLYAIIPSPAKANADRIDAVDTVDLESTANLIKSLIRDGVSGLIALGTTGECATLSDADYRVFAGHVLDIVNRRVPTFIGTSALGGHEVAARMQFIRENQADGTLLGLPMWQPVQTDMAVDFYKQIASAFPDIAVMIYANARAFRYSFPIEFWVAILQQAPTVVAAKYSRPKNLLDLISKTQGRINIIPNEMTAASFFSQSPETTTACWATAAGMGPSPVIALMRAIISGNKDLVERIATDISAANESLKKIFSDPDVFASYNIQVEKAKINAAGYARCGPCRPPYNHIPNEYLEAAKLCGQRWSVLQQKYLAAESMDATGW